jgi:DNA-binding MarR family transcriptional regulator
VPLLTYLWEGHTGDTQNDIARNLGVDKGTVSRNVQSLVKLKLVTQSCSSKDSRACTVELTEAGSALAEPVMRSLREWTEGVCREMNEGRRLHILLELNRMVERSEHLAPGVVPLSPRPTLVPSVNMSVTSASPPPS